MSFKFEIFTKRLIALIILAVMIISLGNSAYANPMGLRNMDTNNDGKITRHEFTAKIDQHFAKIDRNNDGVIKLKELKTFHATKFDKMDRDNNGYLDKKDRPTRHMYERKGHH